MKIMSLSCLRHGISPIFVPSKGRPNPKILNLIPEAVLVVEPQDLESYKNANPGRLIISLDKNDQGISYVRQFILTYARLNNIPSFWQIDDDVSVLYENVNGKTTKSCPYYVLQEAEQNFIEWNTALGALEYSQYCWGKITSSYSVGYCDVAVFFRTDSLKNINYRKIGMKEDRDFAMQTVASGLPVTRIKKFGFFCPKNGSNSGGLKPLYDLTNPEIDACKKVVSLWSERYCYIKIKNDLRIDLKINWKRLRQETPFKKLQNSQRQTT